MRCDVEHPWLFCLESVLVYVAVFPNLEIRMHLVLWLWFGWQCWGSLFVFRALQGMVAVAANKFPCWGCGAVILVLVWALQPTEQGCFVGCTFFPPLNSITSGNRSVL